MTEAIDWRGALDVLVPLGEECGGYVEEGDTKAAKGCVARFLQLDHAVLRLSHCPDMAPVYKSLQLLGMVPGQSMEMRKMAARIRTMRAERKAAAGEGCVPEIEDAPEGVVVPPGYRLDPGGIFDPDGWQIAPEPMFLSAVYADVDTGKAHVRLSWRYRDEWVHRVVPRSQAADARQLTALAEDLAPVTSASANAMVRWLQAQEAASPNLSLRRSTARLGWHGEDGSLGYVLGLQGMGQNEGLPVELHVSQEAERGPLKLARGMTEKGTLEEWRDMIRPLQERPVALMILGAMAAAPLLGVIPGIRSFVLDVWCGSSKGKTSAVRASTSIWGRWDRLEVKWDATRVGLERMAGFLRHLPMIVDDTKHTAENPQRVIEWIYDVTGVGGKLRGTRNSFELGEQTATIGIVTGERSATTMGEFVHQGAKARVLTITGHEFCADGDTAKALERGSLVQYGTAGRAIIDYLIAERDRDGWADIREQYATLETGYGRKLEKKVGESSAGLAHRAAPYLAVIHMGLRLLSAVGAIDMRGEVMTGAMDVGVQATVDGVKSADIASLALDYLLQWASSQRRRFFTPPLVPRDPNHRDPDPGHQGWAGRWDETGLYVMPQQAEAALGKRFDWPAIYNEWKRNGSLVKHNERFTRTVRVGMAPQVSVCRCFKVHPSKIPVTTKPGEEEPANPDNGEV